MSIWWPILYTPTHSKKVENLMTDAINFYLHSSLILKCSNVFNYKLSFNSCSIIIWVVECVTYTIYLLTHIKRRWSRPRVLVGCILPSYDEEDHDKGSEHFRWDNNKKQFRQGCSGGEGHRWGQRSREVGRLSVRSCVIRPPKINNDKSLDIRNASHQLISNYRDLRPRKRIFFQE